MGVSVMVYSQHDRHLLDSSEWLPQTLRHRPDVCVLPPYCSYTPVCPSPRRSHLDAAQGKRGEALRLFCIMVSTWISSPIHGSYIVTPTTPTSAMAGWSSNRASSSAGATWFPLTLINSYPRLAEWNCPACILLAHLDAVNNEYMAVIIDVCHVARLQPTLFCKCVFGSIRTVPIALHYGWSSYLVTNQSSIRHMPKSNLPRIHPVAPVGLRNPMQHQRSYPRRWDLAHRPHLR